MLNFNKNDLKRLLCAALTIIFLVLPLTSCSQNSERSSVGKVGEFDVAYDELYYLATSYKKGLAEKYGDSDTLEGEEYDAFEAELRATVYENIIANHAILTLCAREGLTLEDSGLDARVDTYVDNVVRTNFGGSKSEYRAALHEYGMTDRYVRFVAAVDLLYSDLMTKLLEEGRLVDDDSEMEEIIKRDFICTWHIMIANDEGDDVEANRALAEEALRKYNNGTMSMYELIGSKYNEDFSLTTLDGFYFTKGSMEKEYEDAAFALEVGEISDVVESKGVNAAGERVSCFYLIKRLELDDEYITKNFYELEEAYRDAAVNGMLDAVKAELEFVPNEYCESLILSYLAAPSKDYTELSVIIAACLVIVILVVVTLVVRRRRVKKALIKAKKTDTGEENK